MISKSKGLVLGHVNYGDTSIIAKIYTREFGYQGFIVNSVRSAKSKTGMGYFQPFSVLDLVIYMKPTRDLQRLSEFKLVQVPDSTSIQKQTVLLFLSEVLDKLLRNEQAENHDLFDYLEAALLIFHQNSSLPNFHLQLLLKLCHFIGLSIIEANDLFENMNRFSDQIELEAFIDQLLAEDFTNQVAASGDLRKQALRTLIQYFQHHLDGFGKVNSLKVLSEIFR